MTDDYPDSLRRRRVLTGVGAGLVAVGAGVGTASADQHSGPSVTVSMDNMNASAWEVTAVDGNQDVAPTGTENPTLTLQVGTRYTVENGGWSGHPLAFRDSDDNALLSQSSDGAYADDDNVNWVDDDTTVAFTLTESLAADLDDYVCTSHSSMNGAIETVEQSDEAPADVEFSDQPTIGTSVTVDSVRMDNGGFLTIHDSSLQDGDPLGSVRGVSEYLEPGESQDVTVELNSPPLAEGDTLIAMPHRDNPADENYTFVEAGGEEDPPYTFEGDAIIDDADVQVDGDAAVQMSDQSSPGETVLVDFLRIDDGGFLTIHDSRLLDGEPLESVIGVTDPLDPGVYEDVEVTLDEPLTESQMLIPMPHRDDPSDGEYTFVETGGDEDPPYLDLGGNAVIDRASVTIESGEPPAEVEMSDQESETGETVVVDYLRVDDGGFLTIHDSSLQDGDPLGSVIGVSDVLDPGEYEDLEITLDEPLDSDETLIPMPHRDDPADGEYTFVDSEGEEDPPYLNEGGDAIVDVAMVTVGEGGGSDDDSMDDGMDDDDGGMDDDGGTEDDSMDDEMDNGSEDDGEDGADDGGPGFGAGAGLAGLGGLTAYALRKLRGDPPTPAEDGLDGESEDAADE